MSSDLFNSSPTFFRISSETLSILASFFSFNLLQRIPTLTLAIQLIKICTTQTTAIT
ncbi:TPA: hypothetical protein KN130_003968 [Clostridioides difficile]|uniref:hypothetical protein n=1 Tax=Clostridioides difficile TaxID=1496 RepID=UPI0012ED86EF|nr:hypothetical protein [Clostridioides difficile]DAL33899.1 MAG TPA_asm: hypothetical protein [Caudoviricetes sp.]EIS9213817.1 hypothetical protein [Clostridioides difficile]EIS9643361.1 hypothetical protein [Clostridioides difficile]MBH7256786.1 hypothetical protein [Clostridioides difficile]MBY2779812.1 hypothetical protein [Clostridioides difficile]